MKLLDLNRPISRGMKITILVAMALVSLLYSVGKDGTEGLFRMGLVLLLVLAGVFIVYIFFPKTIASIRKLMGNAEEASNVSETEGGEVPKADPDHTSDDPLDE